MRVTYTKRALTDLDRILAYAADYSPRAANSLIDRLRLKITGQADMPRAGVLTKNTKVRALSTAPLPYMIFYSIDDLDDQVLILRIRHAARKPLSGL